MKANHFNSKSIITHSYPIMKVIVFDTETTGLPTDYNASFTDSSKWPHIIQLAYIVFDTETKEILDYSDKIIKLDESVQISPESIAVHKITRERSENEGIPMNEALNCFLEWIKTIDIIIAHNISFDKKMVIVECCRNQINNGFCFYRNRKPIKEFCTMKNSINICKIPAINKKTGQTYNKYPTLTELHTHLFGVAPKGTHNAIADVMICLRVYIKLTDLYDIANDDEVKLVFRTLFNSYCV